LVKQRLDRISGSNAPKEHLGDPMTSPPTTEHHGKYFIGSSEKILVPTNCTVLSERDLWSGKTEDSLAGVPLVGTLAAMLSATPL